MSGTKAGRNDRVRRQRASRLSLSELAREFGVSKTRIVEILEDTGGDPLRVRVSEDLARATEADLIREDQRLCDRIRSDLRRLIAVREEHESRRTDRILGLSG